MARPSTLSRREALKRAAALATATVVSRAALGGNGKPAASDKPALAGVGVGGVGYDQLQDLEKAGFQVAVLCDVDEVYAKKAFDRWPQARRYRDFREMLAAESDKIDAVYCGTPDHTHAVISLAALRRKKHLCCVKPLTRTVQECRAVVQAARQAGVATQMTAAPNTSEGACRTCELIWAGAIGAVREVHIWTDRPVWPQGMDRPAGGDPVPKTLDWDLWIGPAPMRPFKSVWPDDSLELKLVTRLTKGPYQPFSKGVYHPFCFRGWWDFGTGALGDMGCHLLNTPCRALKLKHPTSVSASSTRLFKETAPLASIVTYDFPAREGMPPVRLMWYDGGVQPPRPIELQGKPMPPGGTLYVGEEGKMLGGRILTAGRREKFADVPRTLPRRPGTWGEWYKACRGGEPAGCAFDWAGPLTELVLLGNIAIRTGKWLAWDADQMKFTNYKPANAYLQETCRSGWKL
jgi:predicted dehydrogenase